MNPSAAIKRICRRPSSRVPDFSFEDMVEKAVDRSNLAEDAKLTLHNVSKVFSMDRGKIQALQAINLTIMKGEFACIVGPSGCGKTTLLNLIAELDKPDQGEILLNEEKPDASGHRLMIFQDAALFPWLNVLENVAFGLRMRGMSQQDRRMLAMEYLSLVKLERFAQCFVHELSGGMKQRVALARALVMSPDILLMDEPFGALDIQTRELLYQELQEIWQRTQTTILFITHNVEEAVYLGDRVIILSGHPGTVQKEHHVNSSRPRQKESPYFQEVCRQISLELLGMGGIQLQEAMI